MPARQNVTSNIEVFFSYSHKDEKYRKKLEEYLAVLKRQGVISDWHDRRIDTDDWIGQIDAHLASAEVILLLISPAFFASDYCYKIEVKEALRRHRKKEALVFPVIVRETPDWNLTPEGKISPLGKLTAFPTDAKAVQSWKPNDKGYADIVRGLRKAVLKLLATKRTPPANQKGAASKPRLGLKRSSSSRALAEKAARPSPKRSAPAVTFQVKDLDGTVYQGTGPADDPWKGFANGRFRAGEFVIVCTGITPADDYEESGYCRVEFQVERKNGKPDGWEVKFLLHPTFEPSDRILTVNAKGGVAREDCLGYGPFVIGAVVVEGGIEVAQLELDLEKKAVKDSPQNEAPPDWWRR